MASSLSIMSMNCRGLRDQFKRKDVFNYLRNLKADIYFLQDTHFMRSDENLIRSQWGFDHFSSYGTNNSRGVSILLNSTFDFKLIHSDHDAQGNLVSIDISLMDEMSITFVNIYGPNTDEPDFYNMLNDRIQNCASDHVIVCGDWNVVQNYDLDCYNYSRQNNPRARQIIKQIDMIDVWRSYNPNKRSYTWYRRNPVRKARLDYFLISEEMMTLVDNCDIRPGYKTDHSMVTLNLKFSDFTRGRGFWRFNNSLLKDKTYIEKVKETILHTKIEYAPIPYATENIGLVDNNILQFTIDDQLFMEMLLLKIRGMTISHSSYKKKMQNETKVKLEKELKACKEECDTNDSPDLLDRITHITQELESIRDNYIKGLLVRTRAKWVDEGEKPTKYFCSLEKRNYINKNVTKLVDSNNTVITDQKAILDEIKKYYSNLYKQDDNLENVDLNDLTTSYNIPKLNNVERNNLEEEISIDEIAKAVRQMKNNKSPGTDGYTPEFFKFFWIDIGVLLFRSFKTAIEKGELSYTQKQGIVSIIPKGNKPREHLKNWRPISLLNITYKIFSTVLANRLKQYLPKLIHDDQKGFMKGRFIGENTRLLYDLLHYTKLNRIPGLLLLVDFEKAFDSISWNFMYKALNFFNFGEKFIKLVKLLNHRANLCVIQHGKFSEFFQIKRGCRQGDPISAYLFNICVEIMGILFRNNPEIKGIQIHGNEYKLSQYADDTCIYLDGSEKSLKNSLDLLDQFHKYSGLKPNITKTQCIWFGEKAGSEDVLCPHYKLQWNNPYFTVLGITFSVNIDDIFDLNCNDKMLEIEKMITHWSRRNLTVIGRITVVKTLILSKINHLLSALPMIGNEDWISSLQSKLYRFIWKNKPDRVSRTLIVQSYENGGLQMTEINSFIKSLKLIWIRRAMSVESTWVSLLHSIIPNFSKIFNFGASYVRRIAEQCDNIFWKEVLYNLESFCMLTSYEYEELASMPIWYNPEINIGGKPVFNDIWFRNGVHIVADLLEGNELISYENFCNRFQFNPSFLLFYGLCQSIRTKWPNLMPLKNRPHICKPFHILASCKCGTKPVYSIFINSLHKKPHNELKWEVDIPDLCQNWKIINNDIFKLTQDVRLRWFQYRILHRILGTNELLFKMGIKESNLCDLCHVVPETITHVLYECGISQLFWNNLRVWMLNVFSIELLITKSSILFHCIDADYFTRITLILAKLHIYSQKMKQKNPNMTLFKQELLNYHNEEEFTLKKNGKLELYEKRWFPYSIVLAFDARN